MLDRSPQAFKADMPGDQPVSVVGVSCVTRPIRFQTQVLAWIVDFLASSLAALVFCNRLRLIPFLTLNYVLTWLMAFSAVGAGMLLLAPQSLGQWIWQIKRRPDLDGRVTFYQRDGFGWLSTAEAGLKTIGLACVVILAMGYFIFGHAVWRVASPAHLRSFTPDSSTLVDWASQKLEPKSDQPRWFAAPFFYHLGLWPSRFDGEAVYYSLTYERGPPKRFVGKVNAHFGKGNEVSLVIEGPKTPFTEYSQDRLRECFTVESSSFTCARVRYRALKRHLEEMRDQGAKEFQVQWFQVPQSHLPVEDQTQGIYLSSNLSRAGRQSKGFSGELQDRFILINAAGLYQSLILTRKEGPVGARAFGMTQQIIGSLRSFRDLEAGRAWVNQELQKIQLSSLNSIQDSQALSLRLAEVQGLLISRVSVEPSHFETYFHLAGTSLMLGVHSHREIALENLNAAFRFGRDVTPNEPRNDLMNGMLAELRNRK